MGQLLATPAWPPDFATKDFYQSLKDASCAKGRACATHGVQARVSEHQMNVLRRGNNYWQGVGDRSLMQRCVEEIVRTLLDGTWVVGLEVLPSELVQLVVDVLVETGMLLSGRVLACLEGATFYGITLDGGQHLPWGASMHDMALCHSLFPERTLERLSLSLANMRAAKMQMGSKSIRYDDAFLMQHAMRCMCLRYLNLEHCPHVTELAVSKLLSGLPRLEEVRIVHCHYVRDVAVGDSDVDGGPALGILSPSIRKLDMQSCIRLRRLWVVLDASSYHLASLRVLSLARCRSIMNADAGVIGSLTNLVSLDVSYTGITDSGVAKLAALTGLEVLNVAGIRAVDSSVAHAVRHMHQLKSLNISRTVLVGNTTLLALSHSPCLEKLHASFTSITNNGLAAALPALAGLKYIDLEACSVGNALVGLRLCPRLEEILIADTMCGNDVAEALSHLGEVKKLDISFTPMVSDIGLRYISKIKPLKTLVMSTMETVSSEALRQLIKVPRLHSLDLSGCRITDAHCSILAKIHTLRHLDVAGSELTSLGVEHLSALPKLCRLSLAHGRYVTDASSPFLMRMTGLKVLNVSGCPLSDRVIKLLSVGLQLKTLALADRPLRCQFVAELVNINADLELKGLKN